ncbi:MAG: hypothetical protein WDO18_06750 [Acidobacteriota bacterium]
MLPLAEITAAPARRSEDCRSSQSRDQTSNECRRPPQPPTRLQDSQRTQVEASATPVAATEVSSDVAQRANDGLLVNGSVNNAASSPFSTLPAFGNNRRPAAGLTTAT